MESIEREVLRRIAPTAEEERRIGEAAEALLGEARRAIAQMGCAAEPLIVGSVAKGTFLANPDIDLFLLFPPSVPREELERLGLAVGAALLPGGERRYAEHPYTHGVHAGFDVDAVPCYRVEDPSRHMTAVDRTPFHTEYIRKNLPHGKRDEVRLLKAFMKGIGAYGAETAVEGFSGYLCELLVLAHGGFREALAAAGNLHPGVPPAPALSLPDPVDMQRNVAAALSHGKLALFIHAAAEYLREPSERFFFPRPPEAMVAGALAETTDRRGTAVVGLSFRVPDIIEDIYYPQLRKCARAVENAAAEGDFGLVRHSITVAGGDALLLFEFSPARVPAVRLHGGPPVGHPNAAKFLDRWKGTGPFILDDRWAVAAPREFTVPEALIRAGLPRLSAGKDLKEAVAGAVVVAGKEILKEARWHLPLTLLFDTRFPWEW